MNETKPEKPSPAVSKLIAVHAYELWENQGNPHGCDQIHWHQAEREIMDCLESNTLDSTRQKS
jgi:hypothetical protein